MKTVFRVSFLLALTSVGVLARAQSLSSVNAPATVEGGSYGQGNVQLSGPSTARLSISFSATGPVSVPASGGVDAGHASGSFYFRAAVVSASTAASISATLDSVTQTANLTVVPASLQALYAQEKVVGGKNGEGAVALKGEASDGLQISLSSSGADLVVPSSVSITAGKGESSFSFSTSSVSAEEDVTITASLGTVSIKKVVHLEPAAAPSVSITALSLKRSDLNGGQLDYAEVSLSGKADPAVSVALSSNSSAATVPASLSISGRDGGSFQIDSFGVDAATTVTITATLGSSSKSATLTVNPASLYVVSAPKKVSPGQGGNASVFLNGFAGPSGVSVSLSSSSPDLQIPASVEVKPNAYTADVAFTTSASASSEEITITATLGSVTSKATVNLQALALGGINGFPNTVRGGSSVVVLVWLNGDSPMPGTLVNLSCDTPDVLSLPTSLTIGTGNFGGFVSAPTSPVTAATVITVSATFNGITKKCVITVLPDSGPIRA